MKSNIEVYVNVAEDENDKGIELPIEKDRSLKTETVASKFSGYFALAYKCENSRGWRLVEKKKEKFIPPQGKWGSTKYICVKGKRLKFKLTNLPIHFNKQDVLYTYLSTYGIVEIKSINKKTKIAIVIIKFISDADLENINKQQHPFTIEEVTQADTEKFSKRSGTTDMGHRYEEMTIAYSLLNLTFDESVQDFRLSSNEEEFGTFDDIILDITFTNGDVRKYAMQVKYKNEDKSLKTHLTKATGDFSIQKYFRDFTDMLEYTKSYNLILFTNLQLFNIREGELLKFGNTNINLKIFKENSITEFGYGSCYKFCPDNVDLSSQYKYFFDKFLLYSDQSSFQTVKQNLQQKFGSEFLFKCSDMFIKFISEWSIKVRKRRLNKKFVKELIALHLLAPYAESFPYNNKEDTEKTLLLKKAIFSFTVTFIDEIHSESIKNIWENETVSDAKVIEAIIDDFQLRNLNDNKKRVAALWIMNKCPLIITESNDAYKVISLCPEKKFILLKKNTIPIPSLNVKAFTKLSDIQLNSAMYEDITKTFSCSLQGKETINLNELMKQCKNLENVITTNELIKMVDDSFTIGERETVLKPYIDRFVTRITIDYDFLNRVDNDTLIIISCQGNGSVLKNRLHSFTLINIENEEEGQFGGTKKKENCDSVNEKTVYFSETQCTQEIFDNMCKLNPNKKRYHHFRIVENGVLEWMYSKGEIGDLPKYKISNCSLFLKESDLINNEGTVNIITADPGMGKTELMKKNCSNYSTSFWTMLLPIRDWSEYLNSKDCNIENFFRAVIEKKCKTELERDIFQILKNTKKITFFWDGLDELSSAQIDTVIDLIDNLVQIGYKQWIACRKHLEDKLEKKFKVFSRSIKEFDKNDQINYIKKRFDNTEITEINLRKVVEKIQDYIGMIHNNEILGIPLQIFMLTELLLNEQKLYNSIIMGNEVFPITDLYQRFIEMKFEIFFKHKYKISKLNHVLENMIKDFQEKQLKYHQKAAILTIIEDKFINKLGLDSILTVSNDETIIYGIGIITRKTNDGKSNFLHFSYAEFLVSLYLYENRNSKFGNLIKEFIFQENYRNIRFMFDLLLAKDCPAHLAVLYNNLDYLKKCQDFRRKDEGGRNPLHIACAWGPRFPLLKTVQQGEEYFIDDEQAQLSNLLSGQHYDEIICLLLEHNSILDKDSLFALNSIEYADLSLSLKPLLIFSEEKYGFRFNALKNFNDIYTVLYYSVKFNYSSVLHSLQDIPFLRTAKSCNSILHLASENNSIDCIKSLLDNDKYRSEINKKNLHGEAPIHLATENGHYELVKYLLESGADVNIQDQEGSIPVHASAAANGSIGTEVKQVVNPKANAKTKKGSTPIYRAALKGHSKIVKHLVELGANINIQDQDGWAPIHAAAENGDIETVKVLVNLKSNVNTKTRKGYTPINRAARRGHHEVVKHLADSGADVNFQDEEGWAPIHAAAENGDIETVKVLVNLKSNVNTKTRKGYTPINRAARRGHHEVVKHLADSGADVNFQDEEGWAPIHAAAENGHIETVKLLVDRKANVNAKTLRGSTSIYRAALKGHYEVVEYLAASGADVNLSVQDGWAPIHAAAENGHIKIVKLLVKLKSDINSKSLRGSTPIYRAALKGHYEVVEHLAESGADINIQDQDGWAPIHAAAENGHTKIVKLLVDQKANVNAKTVKGSTPICRAALKGYYEIVKQLADSGAHVDIQDQDGWAPIHAAAEKGHIEIVKLLIDRKANVNVKHREGFTLIYSAALRGHYKIVKYLVESGTNVNIQGEDGWIPLHAAAGNGHIEIVKLLIDRKANVNVKHREGFTLIYSAALRGHYKIVKYLVESGTNVNIQGEDGWIPLHAAAGNGHIETVKLLVNLKSNVNAKNKDHFTPIYLAAQNGHHQIVKYLAESGADVNIQDQDGWSPIHAAAEHGHIETVKLLVNLKSNLNAKTKKGYTPIYRAALRGHHEVVKHLAESGADVNIQDEEGWAPIHAAAENGHIETVRLLVNLESNVNGKTKKGSTPIYRAARNGHYEVVKYLAYSGADISIQHHNGWTPVHAANENEHIEIVNFLVNLDNVNKKNKKGSTVRSKRSRGIFK